MFLYKKLISLSILVKFTIIFDDERLEVQVTIEFPTR